MSEEAGAEQPDKDRSQFKITVSSVSLLVFAGLASVAGIIVLISALSGDSSIDRFMTMTPVLALLLVAALACVAAAWMTRENALLLGRGLRHLLSIQKAAVACFMVSGSATVGILIFVAASAMTSARVENSLYLLASIELLLKFTAVSAIIVLITLRRAPALVIPGAGPGQQGAAPVTESEDRGGLEFGGLAFAFGLVVIAALVVPTDDLMRISSMLFGNEKKIEDYLPQRPLVRIEDDVPEQVAAAVRNSQPLRGLTEELSSAEQEDLYRGMRDEIAKVIDSVAVDRVRRIGAWPLFRDICKGTEADLIFINSNNRQVAEHIAFLASEGLIEFPYGDINSIDITPYGRRVMAKEPDSGCETNVVATTDIPLDPLPSRSSLPTTIDPTSSAQLVGRPDDLETEISMRANLFRLALPEGNYTLTLAAIDRVDPVLQLFDDKGNLVSQNDDGGIGAFDSLIDVTVSAGQAFILNATSFDGRAGRARLVVSPSEDEESEGASIAERMQRLQQVPLAETADIGPDGLRMGFTALATGPHLITVSPRTPVDEDGDLIGTLFRVVNDQYVLLTEDDDSGRGQFPQLVATLIAGEDYVLFLRPFSPMADGFLDVTLSVTPPVASGVPPGDTEAVDQADPGVEEGPAVPTPSSPQS